MQDTINQIRSVKHTPTQGEFVLLNSGGDPLLVTSVESESQISVMAALDETPHSIPAVCVALAEDQTAACLAFFQALLPRLKDKQPFASGCFQLASGTP